MDRPAELVLQVVRYAQYLDDPPRSPRQWVFLPEGILASWTGARDLLATGPRPLMVAPLLEPGYLGTWGIGKLEGTYRARSEHNLRNQLEGLEHHVAQLGLSDDAICLFETAADAIELPVAEMRRYFTDYVVIVPWSMGPGPDARRPIRLIVGRLDGPWSPGRACRIDPSAA